MDNPRRLEIQIPAADKAELEALAAKTGFRPGALARLAIVQFLERSDLLLTGAAGTTGGDLGAFLTELRAEPSLAAAADQLAEAFSALDMEAGISRDAAGFFECLSILARARGPIEKRLRLMLELVEFKGKIVISRAQLAEAADATGIINVAPYRQAAAG